MKRPQVTPSEAQVELAGHLARRLFYGVLNVSTFRPIIAQAVADAVADERWRWLEAAQEINHRANEGDPDVYPGLDAAAAILWEVAKG